MPSRKKSAKAKTKAAKQTQREKRLQAWHKLFAGAVGAVMRPLNFEVQAEVDLSPSQVVDLIASLPDSAPDPGTNPNLPAGLEELRRQMVFSLKSVHEPFDYLSYYELLGYGVTHLKDKRRAKWKRLGPDLRLVAVAMRKPECAELRPWVKQRQKGVYGIRGPGPEVTLIVPRETRQTKRNAMWKLLSGRPDQFAYGFRHFDWNDPLSVSILISFINYFQLDSIPMALTLEELVEQLPSEPSEEFLEAWLRRISPRKIAETLSPEKIAETLSAEERLEGISAEELAKRLSAEEVLAKLPAKERKKLAAKLLE